MYREARKEDRRIPGPTLGGSHEQKRNTRTSKIRKYRRGCKRRTRKAIATENIRLSEKRNKRGGQKVGEKYMESKGRATKDTRTDLRRIPQTKENTEKWEYRSGCKRRIKKAIATENIMPPRETGYCPTNTVSVL